MIFFTVQGSTNIWWKKLPGILIRININNVLTLYIFKFIHKFTVLLYTTCTDGLQSNFCEHKCTLLYKVMLLKHTAGAQTVLGSVVLLYVYTIEHCLYVFAVDLF